MIFHNLIVIDGLDGVGKTSTATELGIEMSRLGFDVVVKQFEKEYYKSAFTEARKCSNPNIKYFLQLAAFMKFADEIRATSSDRLIISDRYIYSVNAYYSVLPKASRETDPITPWMMPEPQMKILLECNSETRRKRLLERDGYINKRKGMILTKLGDKIHSKLLLFSPWTRINNENLTTSDCVSIISSKYS